MQVKAGAKLSPSGTDRSGHSVRSICNGRGTLQELLRTANDVLDRRRREGERRAVEDGAARGGTRARNTGRPAGGISRHDLDSGTRRVGDLERGGIRGIGVLAPPVRRLSIGEILEIRDHGCRGPVAPVGGEAREHDGHDDGDDNDDDDQFENREAGAGRASREASHPRSGAESREPACGQYLVSSQLSPTPMSTTSGTDSWVACSISCFTRTVISSTSSGGAS